MKDAPAGDFEENDGGVTSSRAVALLPTAVTTAVLAIDPRVRSVGETDEARDAALTDEQLVAAVRRGDRQLGRLLYARLARVIDAALVRVLGPGQPEHDDLMQAVFEEVLRSLFKGRFEGRCKLTSWAASIACHVGLNAIRSRRTERSVFDRSVDLAASAHTTVGACSTEPQLEAREELKRLRSALATLSPMRAEAILLHDALGYDLREVAVLTHSTEAAVQSRLSRGRRDLSERLQLADRPGDESAR